MDFSSIFNVHYSSITNDNATRDATSSDATSGGSSRSRRRLDGLQLQGLRQIVNCDSNSYRTKSRTCSRIH